jgi:hypothetical protein
MHNGYRIVEKHQKLFNRIVKVKHFECQWTEQMVWSALQPSVRRSVFTVYSTVFVKIADQIGGWSGDEK